MVAMVGGATRRGGSVNWRVRGKTAFRPLLCTSHCHRGTSGTLGPARVPYTLADRIVRNGSFSWRLLQVF